MVVHMISHGPFAPKNVLVPLFGFLWDQLERAGVLYTLLPNGMGLWGGLDKFFRALCSLSSSKIYGKLILGVLSSYSYHDLFVYRNPLRPSYFLPMLFNCIIPCYCRRRFLLSRISAIRRGPLWVPVVTSLACHFDSTSPSVRRPCRRRIASQKFRYENDTSISDTRGRLGLFFCVFGDMDASEIDIGDLTPIAFLEAPHYTC